MEKQLFDALIKMCALLCTSVPSEYYKGNPLWDDTEKAIKEFTAKYPDYKTDTGYMKVEEWKAAQILIKLNPSNSGSLKVG